MILFKNLLDFCSPGVSRNIIWEFSELYTPKILFLVVFGLSDTAEIFTHVRALIKVDFPVFGLPIIDIVPHLNSFIFLI